MAARGLVNARIPNGFLDRPLNGVSVEVMAPASSRTRVSAHAPGREDVLPGPLRGGVRVLPRQGVGQMDRPSTQGAVPFPFGASGAEMTLERHDELVGQRGHAILVPFAIAHHDGPVSEIEIFHAKPDAFEKTQTRAVLKTGDEPVGARETAQNATDLARGQNGRETLLALGPNDPVNSIQRLFQNYPVEERERVECLILDGGGDAFLDREMREKARHLVLAHSRGMLLTVEENEAPNPVDVGLLGANAVVTNPNRFAYLIEQADGRIAIVHDRTPLGLSLDPGENDRGQTWKNVPSLCGNVPSIHAIANSRCC